MRHLDPRRPSISPWQLLQMARPQLAALQRGPGPSGGGGGAVPRGVDQWGKLLGSVMSGMSMADKERDAEMRRKLAESQLTMNEAQLAVAARQRTGLDAMREQLLGSPNVPAAEMPGREPRLGAIDALPDNQRGIISAMAGADPMAAAKAGLGLLKPASPYSLASGAARFDADNQLVAERAARPPAIDQKVATLVKSGVPLNIAQGIAGTRYRISRHPINGTVQVVDIGTGDILFDGSRTPAESTEPPVAPPQSAMDPDVDYSKGTGGSGFFGGKLNTFTDLFSGRLAADEVEPAIQGLTNLQIRTQTSLAATVAGRPSKYLLERLDRLAVEPGSLVMGDARAHIRLKQTRNMLKAELARIDRDVLSKPKLWKPTQLAEARANKSEIQGVLLDYEVVIRSFNKAKRSKASRSGRKPTAEEEALMKRFE